MHKSLQDEPHWQFFFTSSKHKWQIISEKLDAALWIVSTLVLTLKTCGNTKILWAMCYLEHQYQNSLGLYVTLSTCTKNLWAVFWTWAPIPKIAGLHWALILKISGLHLNFEHNYQKSLGYFSTLITSTKNLWTSS